MISIRLADIGTTLNRIADALERIEQAIEKPTESLTQDEINEELED